MQKGIRYDESDEESDSDDDDNYEDHIIDYDQNVRNTSESRNEPSNIHRNDNMIAVTTTIPINPPPTLIYILLLQL